MKKLMAIGEALIDFIPEESGKAMKDVCGFQPAVGGAPANVCGAYRKLGGPALLFQSASVPSKSASPSKTSFDIFIEIVDA